MRLDLFENGREHLSTVLRGFKNSIDTSGDANAQKAQDSKETYKKQLEGYEIDKANAEKQMEYWHQKEAEFSVELSKSNIEQAIIYALYFLFLSNILFSLVSFFSLKIFKTFFFS